MTPRQRVLALLNGERPDRIPTDYWATGEFDTRLKKDLGCPDDQTLWQKLHIDAPRKLAPRALLKHHPDDPQADLWGIRHRSIQYRTGSYVEVARGPLEEARSVADIHAFAWPSPDDFDYEPVRTAVQTDDGYRPICSAVYEPFLIYCAMRGMEQAYEDLVLEPDIADAIFGHLFDFHYEHNRRIYEAGGGRIDWTYVAEDLGSQTGPLIGLDTYRRFMRANQKKMADLARSFGIHVFFHTDGASYQFIEDLVEVVGIEVLNPIQWRCEGMDRRKLVREFGGRVIFHGAMDNQHTLAFGTVADVVAEVKENSEIFAEAAWICAPCHNIQAVSPTQNVIAMYETVHEFGIR